MPRQEVVAFTFHEGLTRLHTATEQLWMQPTLAALARRLDGDTFFQVSRTAIVSLDAIREAKPFPDGTGEVVMSQRAGPAGDAAAVASAHGTAGAVAETSSGPTMVAMEDGRTRLVWAVEASFARIPAMPLSRRDLLSLAARASAFGAVAHALPWTALSAQGLKPTIAPGKEKLLVRSLRPPDYESPVALLDSFITPVEHFYVRSHLPVPPGLDGATWTLAIDGEVNSAAVAVARRDAQAALDHHHDDARVRRQRPRVLRSAGGRHPVGKRRGRHGALDWRPHWPKC